MSEQRVLPAAAYDTYEMTTLIAGGIGRCREFAEDGTPCCIRGHEVFATGIAAGDQNPLTMMRLGPGVAWSMFSNDRAVSAINERLHRTRNTRVSWKAYCAELNIVRGD